VSLTEQLQADGLSNGETVRFLRSFNGYAPEFRTESDRLAAQAGER
jgi:hypothetical protein